MQEVKKKLLPEGIDRKTRTEFLNQAMRSVVPSICVERAKIVTESYKRTEGKPFVMRRAIALKDLLEQMTIFIDREELIVGNHGSRPRAALIFPEFGTFDKKELDLMPVRKVDTLQISEEDKKFLLEEIYPYWENRCTGNISRYYVDEKIMKVLDSPYRVFNPLSRTRSGYGHYLPNIEKILKQTVKKLDVISAACYTDKEIFSSEIAMYKISTNVFDDSESLSWLLREYNTHVVEVTPEYIVVELTGSGEDITELREKLQELGCIRQFVRSGRIAVTASNAEKVSELMEKREQIGNKRQL